jgi:anti-sigma factor RsiW
MTCRDVIEFLMDYEAGDVTPAERSIFDAHLAICPECVAYLNTYRTTVALGRAAARVENAQCPEAPEELVRAILAARPK